MSRPRHRGPSQPRAPRTTPQPQDKACKALVSRICPTTRAEVSGYAEYVEAPQDKNAQRTFRQQGQQRMLELAAMALAAKRAEETEQAQRCEAKISIVKAALGQT